MQNRHKKKMDIAVKSRSRNVNRRGETLYFVVGKGKIEKKLQIMSLPAAKIRVQYPV